MYSIPGFTVQCKQDGSNLSGYVLIVIGATRVLAWKVVQVASLHVLQGPI